MSDRETAGRLRELQELLEPSHFSAAEALVPQGATIEECPHLLRVLEDLAAARLYGQYVGRGESTQYALERAAGDLGMPASTLRYRIERIGVGGYTR